MKKLFSGLGVRAVALLASIGAEIKNAVKGKSSFNAPESNPQRRSGKSSGGKAKLIDRNPRYHAWKKCFGGLAVPSYQG